MEEYSSSHIVDHNGRLVYDYNHGRSVQTSQEEKEEGEMSEWEQNEQPDDPKRPEGYWRNGEDGKMEEHCNGQYWPKWSPQGRGGHAHNWKGRKATFNGCRRGGRNFGRSPVKRWGKDRNRRGRSRSRSRSQSFRSKPLPSSKSRSRSRSLSGQRHRGRSLKRRNNTSPSVSRSPSRSVSSTRHQFKRNKPDWNTRKRGSTASDRLSTASSSKGNKNDKRSNDNKKQKTETDDRRRYKNKDFPSRSKEREQSKADSHRLKEQKREVVNEKLKKVVESSSGSQEQEQKAVVKNSSEHDATFKHDEQQNTPEKAGEGSVSQDVDIASAKPQDKMQEDTGSYEDTNDTAISSPNMLAESGSCEVTNDTAAATSPPNLHAENVVSEDTSDNCLSNTQTGSLHCVNDEETSPPKTPEKRGIPEVADETADSPEKQSDEERDTAEQGNDDEINPPSSVETVKIGSNETDESQPKPSSKKPASVVIQQGTQLDTTESRDDLVTVDINAFLMKSAIGELPDGEQNPNASIAVDSTTVELVESAAAEPTVDLLAAANSISSTEPLPSEVESPPSQAIHLEAENLNSVPASDSSSNSTPSSQLAIPTNQEKEHGEPLPAIGIRTDIFDSALDERSQLLLSGTEEKVKQTIRGCQEILKLCKHARESGNKKTVLNCVAILRQIGVACQNIVDIQLIPKLYHDEVLALNLTNVSSSEFADVQTIDQEEMADYFMKLLAIGFFAQEPACTVWKDHLQTLHFRMCRVLNHYAVGKCSAETERTFNNIQMVVNREVLSQFRVSQEDIIRLWHHVKYFHIRHPCIVDIILCEQKYMGFKGFMDAVDSILLKAREKVFRDRNIPLPPLSPSHPKQYSFERDMKLYEEFVGRPLKSTSIQYGFPVPDPIQSPDFVVAASSRSAPLPYQHPPQLRQRRRGSASSVSSRRASQVTQLPEISIGGPPSQATATPSPISQGVMALPHSNAWSPCPQYQPVTPPNIAHSNVAGGASQQNPYGNNNTQTVYFSPAQNTGMQMPAVTGVNVQWGTDARPTVAGYGQQQIQDQRVIRAVNSTAEMPQLNEQQLMQSQRQPDCNLPCCNAIIQQMLAQPRVAEMQMPSTQSQPNIFPYSIASLPHDLRVGNSSDVQIIGEVRVRPIQQRQQQQTVQQFSAGPIQPNISVPLAPLGHHVRNQGFQVTEPNSSSVTELSNQNQVQIPPSSFNHISSTSSHPPQNPVNDLIQFNALFQT